MRNYQIYFALMALCAAAVLCIIIGAISKQSSMEMLGILYIQIPLGIGQLMVGLYLWIKRSAYPAWVREGIKNYWRFNLIYFAVFLIPIQILWIVWLTIVPWAIAIYQFCLVYRMAALRKRQLQKRQLLQFS